MKKLTLFIGTVLYITTVRCQQRKNVEALEYDSIDYSYSRPNRGRRWEINYNYEASPYRPERRDSRPSRQDSLPRIVSLLEDITTYLKRPETSIAQPIYVPYIIPFPISIPVSSIQKETTLPTIAARGPEIFDGKSSGQASNSDEDGGRPISFVPIQPDRAQKRLAPKVEHGSVQEDIGVPQVNPSITTRISPSLASLVKTCSAAVLACCVDKTEQQRRICLYSFGCDYNNGESCSRGLIKDALESFNSQYSTKRT